MQLLRPDLDTFHRAFTFSILGRIGGDATGPSGLARAGVILFQYPRSDRRRCNPG